MTDDINTSIAALQDVELAVRVGPAHRPPPIRVTTPLREWLPRKHAGSNATTWDAKSSRDSGSGTAPWRKMRYTRRFTI